MKLKIFYKASLWRKLLIIRTIWSCRIYNFKYERSTTSGCKDIKLSLKQVISIFTYYFLKVRPANTSNRNISDFFSPPLSRAEDISRFLAELRQKSSSKAPPAEPEVESLNQPRRWFHVSDTAVSEVTEEKVLKAQAYLLFYERILWYFVYLSLVLMWTSFFAFNLTQSQPFLGSLLLSYLSTPLIMNKNTRTWQYEWITNLLPTIVFLMTISLNSHDHAFFLSNIQFIYFSSYYVGFLLV